VSNDRFDILTFGAAGDTAASWGSGSTRRPASRRGRPRPGCLRAPPTRPLLGERDAFVFEAHGDRVDAGLAKAQFTPYVVPNPYVGSASFEPERFAISGRGERRVEFRGLPQHCTIRIYTVRGDLVQTLQHDGSDDGFIAWNLRTKDNLDLAPGLYIFHVDGSGVGEKIGKFAVIK
jgi:hypothetical protein